MTEIRWIHYRTPDIATAFDRVCPWCGQAAAGEVAGMISWSLACGCGAIALGAPAYDFDEVVDDMLDHFQIHDAPADRYDLALAWLAAYPVDHVPGGKDGETFWYWFRARRDPA